MQIMLIVLLLLPGLSKADSLWIQGPNSENSDYQTFLMEDSQRIGWLEGSIINQLSQLRPIGEAIHLANLTDAPTSSLISKIQELEKGKSWSEDSVMYLRDYFKQVLESKKIDVQLRDRYLSQYCYYQTLLQESGENCITSVVNLTDFKKMNPEISMLFMNHLQINLAEQNQIQVTPESDYHWLALNSKSQPRKLYGKAEEILNQKINFENLVNGNCTEFNSNFKNGLEKTEVFFSKACQRSMKEAGVSVAWYRKKSNWAWGVLLLASVWYLHDKTVQVTLPSL